MRMPIRTFPACRLLSATALALGFWGCSSDDGSGPQASAGAAGAAGAAASAGAGAGAGAGGTLAAGGAGTSGVGATAAGSAGVSAAGESTGGGAGATGSQGGAGGASGAASQAGDGAGDPGGSAGVAGAAGSAGMSAGSAGVGGAGDDAGAAGMESAGSAGAAGGGDGGGEFTLSSSELEEGGAFAPNQTCAVAGFDNDESPALEWIGAPAGTQSFAIVFQDRTLTDDGDVLGFHSVFWDIPADVTGLPANMPNGASLTSPVIAKQYNPVSPSYLGPCPNFGAGGGQTHTYEFALYAMPEAVTAELAGVDDVEQMEQIIIPLALGIATLAGTSDASPP